jgi:hypothetical protein
MRTVTMVALAAVTFASLATCVHAQDTTSFAGKWAGPWTNSLGEKGDSNLKLTEDADGVLTGTWDGVKVKGERINKNTIELRGKNETRSYQLTCTVKGGKMEMKYVVTRLNMEGSYDGKATLTRE